jgi:hypothetical protein
VPCPPPPAQPSAVYVLQDETYYDAYNNRFGELHGPISFEPYRQAATDFKDTVLYSHIAGEAVQTLQKAMLAGPRPSEQRPCVWGGGQTVGVGNLWAVILLASRSA